METYVVVSPNRANQLTLLRKAQRSEPLGSGELDSAVDCMFRVTQAGHQYLLLGLTDATTVLVSLLPQALEEHWRIDMKLVASSGDLAVFANGIYRVNYPLQKLELLLEARIERAAAWGCGLTYSTSSQLVICELEDNGLKRRSTIELGSPLAALHLSEGLLLYSEWNSLQINVLGREATNVISVPFHPRCMEVTDNHLFVGGSTGLLQIYSIRDGYQLKQSFSCGSLPTKLVRVASTLYCLSSSVVAVTIDKLGLVRKSMVALREVSSLQQGL